MAAENLVVYLRELLGEAQTWAVPVVLLETPELSASHVPSQPFQRHVRLPSAFEVYDRLRGKGQ